MIRILIADDHPLIRKGLRQILSDYKSIQKIDEASNGFDVLTMIEKNNYDAVILDISMPGKDGIDILGDIKKRKPRLPILMLSIQPEEQYAIRALKLGASGCINKATAPEELINAIKKVVKGQRHINQKVDEILVGNLSGNDSEYPHKKLSEREFQVMLLITSGNNLTEIADKLFLSIKTVSTYKVRLLRKMGMHKTTQLIDYVLKNKLLS